MAGGSFDILVGKVRPGTYVNFKNASKGLATGGRLGRVLLPLFDHNYGPDESFVLIPAGDADAKISDIGLSVYEPLNMNMRMINEALKNADEVLVYLPKKESKAELVLGNLTVRARHGGSLANDLKISIKESDADGDLFDVLAYLGTRLIFEKRGVLDAGDLVGEKSDWLDFEGSGSLAEAAGVNLEGGQDAVFDANCVSDFFALCEGKSWNTLAWPYDEFKEDVRTKIKYLRESAGLYRKAVCANFNANYEGIINLTNSVVLSDGVALTAEQATAWVAGADASASMTDSLTFKEYQGAIEIVDLKNHAEAVEAIEGGEFFFSNSGGNKIVVEYDINSLTSFDKKDESYRKNRVLRVLDSFAEAIKVEFPPNKFDNGPLGWDVMEGIGKALLRRFEDAGAIANVDYDRDFLVNRNASYGDSTFFNIGLMAVDSAEKLYFEVKTQ